MMLNSTQVSYLILGAYSDRPVLTDCYFMIVLTIYIVIVVSNVFLIVVICMNRSLHEPMYLYLCSLLVNELFGSTGLFPFLLFQILTDVHTVPVPLCFLQILCIYTYATVEFAILSAMSYDRYLAICYPLQYHKLMTHAQVVQFTALMWLFPFLSVVIIVSLSSPLHLCGNIIDKVYCDNYSVVKLSCSDTTVNNVYGLISLFFTICVPALLIVYTYMRILKVCFSGSKQTRHKAVTTCTPHLASLINFTIGCCFEVVQSRFDMKHVPNMLRIILSVYFITLPPIFNPLIFGLKMSKIRLICSNMLSGKHNLDLI